MAGNPVLSRNILERFVDTNHDGSISTRELFAASNSLDNQNNDNY